MSFLPLSDRISNAFISYITYIRQTILPYGFAILYPHPGLIPTGEVFWEFSILTVITVMVIWKSARFPYLAVGWLWYVGTLVPVIGIVQVGFQSRADRYTYVPLIGLFIIAAWGVPELFKNWRYRKEALFASSTVILLCLCIITWTQVRYWKNSITLFEHTLQVTDKNSIARYNLGVAYRHLGNDRQAIENYDKAIKINPNYVEARTNRGLVYAALGNDKQAISDFDKAIEINPTYAEAYYNRGISFRRLGNGRQAIGDFDKAIELKPKYAEAYNSRGVVYAALGSDRQAIGDYDHAIEINPKYAEAYYNHGNSDLHLGNYREALGDYDKAIEINVKYAEAYNNRGYAYWRLGNYKQAIEDLKTAARLGYKDAQNTLKGKGIGWQSPEY